MEIREEIGDSGVPRVTDNRGWDWVSGWYCTRDVRGVRSRGKVRDGGGLGRRELTESSLRWRRSFEGVRFTNDSYDQTLQDRGGGLETRPPVVSKNEW